MSTSPETPESRSEEAHPVLWARLRPYNPQNGCLVERFSINNSELGIEPSDASTIFEGGDGITKIPVWYAVSQEQAEVLRTKSQPTAVGGIAAPAFEIVTETERKEIDKREESLRMQIASTGMRGITSITNKHLISDSDQIYVGQKSGAEARRLA